MKRVLCFAAAVFLLLAAPAFARADQGGEWKIEELGLTLAMPEDAYVFTRGIAEDDPGLAFLGITREELVDFLAGENDYLMAAPSDWRYEIYLTVEEEKNSYVSLSAFNEEELADAVRSIREDYIEDGAELHTCAVYDSGRATFIEIRYNYTEENYTKFLLEYYTIYNNRSISLIFFSNYGEVSDAQQEVMRALVNEIRFNGGDPRQMKNKSGGGKGFGSVPIFFTVGGGGVAGGLWGLAINRKKKKGKPMPAEAFGDAASGAPMPPEAQRAGVDARLLNVGGAQAAGRCAACGQALEPDAAFCGSCGARTGAGAP